MRHPEKLSYASPRINCFSLFVMLLVCFFLCSCGSSRVDPISPDIHGVSVTPPPSLAAPRYYYEKQDPVTQKWYEAHELMPGFGLMVYTKEGARKLHKDKEDPK